MTRAADLPREARAFLDAIAIGESGGADDDAAYSILFGGGHFDERWPSDFPQWAGKRVGNSMTHAAGRYQFEPATWAGLGGGNFAPENQDLMAWALATEVYVRRTGNHLLDMLTADDLDGIGDALTSTWTSVTSETFAARYRGCLAKLAA